MPPLVYIIILNWNGHHDTIECVDSCKKLTYSNFRILVVDNGSDDESERVIRAAHSDVEVIQTGSNLGFAGGNNFGIRHALANGAELIWLLNNDTTVDADALTALVAAVSADPTIGIAGSKIHFFSRPDVIWFAGGFIEMSTGDTGHYGEGEQDKGQFDAPREMDYISGCSLLIRRKAIDTVGLMDDRFFLLYEETDWNVRVRRAGYSIRYIPTSTIRHKISQSIGEFTGKYQYYLTRNSLLFLKKHNPSAVLRALATKMKKAVTLLLTGNVTESRYISRGVLDFLLGRYGVLK